MYRSGELHREFGMRGGPYTGGRLALAASSLPARTRQRLSAALLGAGPCAPVLFEGPQRRSRGPMLLGVAAGTVGLFALGGWGFGILGDSWAVQPWSAVWAYGGLLGLLAWSLVGLVRSIRDEGLVPLPQGRYLLPYDLVEIAGGVVTVRPFGDARQVRVDEAGRSARILYADGSLELVTSRSWSEGPSAWARLLAAQHEVEEATYEGAPLAADPLAELRDRSGWAVPCTPGGTSALGARSKPVAPRMALVACVALAAVAAPAAWTLRNRASDDAMFARATDSVDYRTYLRGGGARHAALVRDTLLPRTALDEAERRGDFRSLRAFLREFPASRYDVEARTRFHDACVTELAHQSIETIRSFDTRNPDCHVERDVRERLHAAYQERFEEATGRGLDSLRGYVRSAPDDPFFHDRAVAKLSELYGAERHKVRSVVERAELREVLLGIAGRAQRDEMPGELYVPVTIVDDFVAPDLAGTQATRGVLAGFDAALHDVLDGALVAIYHPTNVAPADLARAHTLRIVIWSVPDDDNDTKMVRYELATGARTVAKWTRQMPDDADPERFGAELAHGAMTL
jgi:hypothetical protein